MADLPPGATPIQDPESRGYALPPGARVAEPTQRPDSGTTLERGAYSLGQGFYKGLAGLVGLPVDAMTGLVNLAGRRSVPEGTGNRLIQPHWRIENPIGGSANIRQGMEALGLIGLETRPGIEQTLERVGTEVGASVGALTGVGAAARAGVTGNAVTRPFIQTFAQSPGLTTTAELAAAAGAGVAGSVAEEIVSPESPLYPTTQVVAEIVGGGVPDFLISGATGIYRRGQQAAAPFTPAGERRAVGQELREQALDPERAVENLAAARPLETTGQASGDPGLVSGERALSAQMEGPFRARETAQNEALRNWFDALKPPPGPAATQDFFRDRIGAINRTMDFHIAAAGQYADQQIAAAGLPIDSPEANQIVRDALRDALEFERGQERLIWNAIDPSGALEVDVEGLRNAFDQWADLRLKSEQGDIPQDVLDIVSRLGLDGETVVPEPIDEILGLRRVIGNKIRQAEAAQDFNRARLLRELRDETDRFLSELDFEGSPEMRERYQAARDFSVQLNDKFTRGEVGRVLGFSRQGGELVPEELTLERLFRSGEAGGVTSGQALESLGSRTEAIDALQRWAMTNFVDFATNPTTGRVDPRALGRWRERFGPSLRNFPELDAATSNVFNAQREIERMTALERRTTARLERTRAQGFVNADPQSAVRNALTGATPVRNMSALVQSARRDPSGVALQGLQRGFLDMIPAELRKLDAAGNPFLNPGAVRTFFNRNETVLRDSGLFSDEELAHLMDFTDALERSQRVVLATPRAGSDTSQKTLTLNQMLSRLYGIERGVVGPRFVISEVGARVINRFLQNMRQEHLSALLTDAYLDPDLARTLMLEVTPQNAERTVNRLRLHLINNGYATEEELNGNEE